MQPGMIGLGRMGANLMRRLMRDGPEVVVLDVNADSVRHLESKGPVGATILEEFAARLDAPRMAWMMVSAALYERFSLRGEADFGDQLLSAMRDEFGGRVEKAAAGAR